MHCDTMYISLMKVNWLKEPKKQNMQNGNRDIQIISQICVLGGGGVTKKCQFAKFQLNIDLLPIMGR